MVHSPVDEGDLAILCVSENAQLVALFLIVVELRALDCDEVMIAIFLTQLLAVVAAAGVVEERLALDAVFELDTLAGASWTFCAGVSCEVLIANAFAAVACAVPVADFASRRSAALVGLGAAAVGSLPAGLAFTLSADAGAAVFAAAELVVVAVAREVVALTKLARDFLERVCALVAAALATVALTPAGAEAAVGRRSAFLFADIGVV